MQIDISVLWFRLTAPLDHTIFYSGNTWPFGRQLLEKRRQIDEQDKTVNMIVELRKVDESHFFQDINIGKNRNVSANSVFAASMQI